VETQRGRVVTTGEVFLRGLSPTCCSRLGTIATCQPATRAVRS